MPHRHIDLELADLKRSLAIMGNLVEQVLDLAVKAIVHPVANAKEQAKIIETTLDELETTIEERCHSIIALQSPVAGELRLVISCLRLTAELEQIGDLAESVAKRASFIARHQTVDNPPQLPILSQKVLSMVHESLEAFLTGNLQLAKAMLQEEPECDRLVKSCYHAIQDLMLASPMRIREYTHLLRAVGLLEAIADLAISVGDEAVYLHRGDLIRHQHKAERGENPASRTETTGV